MVEQSRLYSVRRENPGKLAFGVTFRPRHAPIDLNANLDRFIPLFNGEGTEVVQSLVLAVRVFGRTVLELPRKGERHDAGKHRILHNVKLLPSGCQSGGRD